MELKKINNTIKNCNKCQFNKETDVRYCGGIGNDHRVMFVCESPSTSGGVGIFDGEQGFKGHKAVELFYEYRKKYGLENCYTTDFVKCGKPNQKPSEIKISNCLEYLKKEIEIVNPKVIVGVGQIAHDLLKENIKTEIPMVFMHHYSYIYRWCKNNKDKLEEYDEQFKEVIKKSIQNPLP